MEEIAGESKWETEKHVRFTMAAMQDIQELKLFLHQHMFTDAPVARNIKVMEGNGWIDKYLRSLFEGELLMEPISRVTVAPASIIARSTEGNNDIIGCRIGAIYDRENFEDSDLPNVLWIGNLPACLPIPKKIIAMLNVMQHLVDLNYSKSQAFAELKDAKRIYFCATVCVSDKARGMGLGTELVKRGYDIAVRTGCDYTYSLASSIYSQKIFHKLGNVTILHERSYEDYKYDKKGRPFLIDPREHKVIQVLAITHKQ